MRHREERNLPAPEADALVSLRRAASRRARRQRFCEIAAGVVLRDANRSARVERPFWFIENNFLAGRTFDSWQDLNQRAREWCDKVNSTHKKHIRAVPRELFVTERPHLKPLPAWVTSLSLCRYSEL